MLYSVQVLQNDMAIGLLLSRNFLSGLRTLKSKNLENLKPENFS